jgi:hypothetical protein
LEKFFVKGDTNGKKKDSKGALEHARFEPAQTAVSHNADVQNRQKDETQYRRRKKEGVQDGTQKIKGVFATHRQGITCFAAADGV